jgi:hypothetical protein
MRLQLVRPRHNLPQATNPSTLSNDPTAKPEYVQSNRGRISRRVFRLYTKSSSDQAFFNLVVST